MNNLIINLTNLTNDCLKKEVHRSKIFSLDTNLSELGGPGLHFLSESLLYLSMQIPNKTILEIIMLENQYAFRTSGFISTIMKKDGPVMEVFLLLGNYDCQCNLRWLICCLYRLGELVPLKNILSRAPPLIIKEKPNQRNTILPGETIQFQVRSVSKAEISWRRSDGQNIESIGEPIRMDACSIITVSHKIKPEDRGVFFIVVTSLRIYHEKSEKIHVGPADTEHYGQAIAELNGGVEKIKRVALLIGIMKYQSCTELEAPKDDINELDPILRKIGYTVHSFADLDIKQLKHVLDRFSQNCIDKNTYVFFYFAGHGLSEDKNDFVQLTGISEKLEIKEILKVLSTNKPKVLVTIFDTCRNDINNQNTEGETMAEANLSIGDGMMLVMTTFPNEKAYEKKRKYEAHSLIMKSLRSCLENYGCNCNISFTFAHFVNDPSIKDQRPAIYAGPMPYFLGIEGCRVQTFKPKIKFLNGEIEMDFNFDVFHNMLNLWLDNGTKDYFKYSDFGYLSHTFVKEVRVNLFNMKSSFHEDGSLNLKIHRFEQETVGRKSVEIAFKIIFPNEISNFFKNFSRD